MSDVFLSYASEDRPAAQVLAGVLQGAGLAVWYDQGLGGDTPYHEQITQQVELAAVVVACWSDKSRESRWVYSEADAADKLGKLINVRLDSSIPPQPFDRLNAHDLSGWSGNLRDSRYIGLLEDIRRGRSMRAGIDPGPRVLPAEMPATRAWLHIHNSLDAIDYRKFLLRHPNAPQRRVAEEHLNDLETFSKTDQDDAAALHDFLISGPFEALGELAKDLIADLVKKPTQDAEQEAERHLQEKEIPIIRTWLRLYWVTAPLAVVALTWGMANMFSITMRAQRNPEGLAWEFAIGILGMLVAIVGLVLGPFLIVMRRVRSQTLGEYMEGKFRQKK